MLNYKSCIDTSWKLAPAWAAKYTYIDLERVGIYGHSGGGFMTAAAMMIYPDFFKVRVASSGNHDNNIYGKFWTETYQGVT